MTDITQDLNPARAPAPAPPPQLPAVRGWRMGDVARAALVALAVWFGLQLLWSVYSLVFLVFLATLFGLAAARGTDYLERFKIRRGIGAAIIVLGTLGLIGGGLALTAPTLIEQGKELQNELPSAISQAQRWIDSKRGGLLGSIIKSAGAPAPSAVVAPAFPVVVTAPPTVGSEAKQLAKPIAGAPPASEAIKQRITDAMAGASKYVLSFVSNTIAVFTAFILIVFLAIYIGAEPEVYRGWMLSTVPASSRAQVRVVLAEMSKVLRKWLVTQLVAMLAIGGGVTIVLLLLGVKAPYALGFIAGLLEFIPTVGPILSAIPAVAMGFVDSPEKALTVLVAYWGIQFVENNLLIPFLMRGEMDLPPAITIIAQSVMTLVFGFIGLMVAVPLTAAVLVPLRMIAERENERERELRKRSKLQEQDMLTDDVNPVVVVSQADHGPKHSPTSKDVSP